MPRSVSGTNGDRAGALFLRAHPATTVLTSIVASVQENIGPSSLSIHLIVAIIWIAIGITASYVPAARAARLDPSAALRDE